MYWFAIFVCSLNVTTCIFQVTELKAQYFEFDKEMRARIQTLQKQHNETVESLQVSKIISLLSRSLWHWFENHNRFVSEYMFSAHYMTTLHFLFPITN